MQNFSVTSQIIDMIFLKYFEHSIFLLNKSKLLIFRFTGKIEKEKRLYCERFVELMIDLLVNFYVALYLRRVRYILVKAILKVIIDC